MHIVYYFALFRSWHYPILALCRFMNIPCHLPIIALLPWALPSYSFNPQPWAMYNVCPLIQFHSPPLTVCAHLHTPCPGHCQCGPLIRHTCTLPECPLLHPCSSRSPRTLQQMSPALSVIRDYNSQHAPPSDSRLQLHRSDETPGVVDQPSYCLNLSRNVKFIIFLSDVKCVL